jgi:hypothetical protein
MASFIRAIKVPGGLKLSYFIFRVAVLLLPTGLLLAAALRFPGARNPMLWLATAFSAIVCCLSLFSWQSWKQPLGTSVITLYLIALTWLWWGDGIEDSFTHLSKAILLMIPLLVFGFQTLVDSGATAMRRANLLANCLANRKDWPSDLPGCRALPEVKAFRAAIVRDAAPALALMQHPRPEVRVAALAALEYRKDWRPGQAALVLQVAQHTEQPALRAAAVAALANVDDRLLVETVAQFLHDASWEVRRAAIESLLWDTENRWSWIRFAVRRILADPLFLNDGPLVPNGQMLTAEAVNDLTAWCAEKGALATRASLTLGAHYSRALSERPEEGLVKSLRQQLADPHTPAILRIEIGRILQYHQELDEPVLEKMIDPSNPAPLRLIACETLLAESPDGPQQAAAIGALRDLARLPNREIALATADVIQRRLGVDLGLGLGQPLPPIHSRQAAEITRRVMAWATQYDLPENVEDSAPLARGERAGVGRVAE